MHWSSVCRCSWCSCAADRGAQVSDVDFAVAGSGCARASFGGIRPAVRRRGLRPQCCAAVAASERHAARGATRRCHDRPRRTPGTSRKKAATAISRIGVSATVFDHPLYCTRCSLNPAAGGLKGAPLRWPGPRERVCWETAGAAHAGVSWSGPSVCPINLGAPSRLVATRPAARDTDGPELGNAVRSSTAGDPRTREHATADCSHGIDCLKPRQARSRSCKLVKSTHWRCRVPEPRD